MDMFLKFMALNFKANIRHYLAGNQLIMLTGIIHLLFIVSVYD